MNTNTAGPLPGRVMEPNGNADDLDGVLKLQGSRRDETRGASVTIPIPKAILRASSFISSLAAVERNHITPIFTVLFVEGCFLTLVGWSYKDVLSALFFTSLLGRFVCPVWANLKRLHCKLDDIFKKIEALQQAIKSLESNTVVLPPAGPAEPDVHILFPREQPPLKPIVNREVKHVGSEFGSLGPVASVDTDRHPIPYKISTPEPVETPVVTENHSPVVPPAVPQPHADEGVNLEGLGDNTAEVRDAHPPVVPPVVIRSTPTVPPAQPQSHPDEGVTLEGFGDNIVEVPDTRPPAIPPVGIRSTPTVPPAQPQSHPDEGVTLEGFGDNIVEVPVTRPPAIPPVVIKDSPPPPPPSVPPATSSPDPVDGVSFEGWDNIIGEPEVGPEPVTHPVVNRTPSAPSGHDRDGGVQLEGMNNIAEESDAPQARGSSEQLTEGGYSRSLPFLREIKQRLEQATEGKIERNPHLDQSSNSLSVLRWAMRLLMSAASLVPSAFAPHSGFFGPVESTPYYPTGDLSRHRDVAFSTAMDCIDNLEAYIPGGDDIRIATKLVALAQALSDLGLHDYALTTSGFALDALQRPYTTEPNSARLHIASVLSLRANILCDLKKNDEADGAAERAVTLCREHKNSQTAPVPELAYALLNYAVILNAIDRNEGSAAVAFELLGELDESQPETKEVLALAKLCVSTSRIGADNDLATSMADETIDSTRMSLDANSQTILVGALLAKSKALSSKDQNDAASTVSAEVVALLRNMSVTRPVFSLFLAHALDTHAHHLSENRRGESYSVRQDAVEHWQTLKATAGGAVARPLAWSLFELAKFRRKGADRQALREEFRIAECAVEMFREAEPLDAPGLGDALYLYADRMLELDKNQEAATYAEESVIYFQEAASKDPKYALDLIFSLSLASACLACTEGDAAAFGYAKQAVEIQRGRRGVGDPQYDGHLRKLLMDVVFRATEMDRPDEAAPWYEELQSLGGLDGGPLARRSGGQGEDDRFRKQTSFWMDATTDAPRSNNGSFISSPATSSSTLRVDKGKGKEVAPSPELGSSTPRVDKGKGKAREVNSPFDSSAFGQRQADEEIISPGAAAAAQHRLGGLGNTGSILGGMGSGMGGLGMTPGGGRTLGGIPGMGMGGGINGFSGSRPGSSPGSSPTPRPGSRSGTGIQSNWKYGS